MNSCWLPLLVFLAVPAATLIATALRPEPPSTGAALGRQVYISEGCMHCHSQFMRPGSRDEELWGAARDPEFSRQQAPALIGNRRQGPDLMNVGARRTRDWQRLHLATPRLIAQYSRMPSYAHLFAEGNPRGDALLDYLGSLGQEGGTAGLKAP
jgi:cytochrome c oxidase cbb3-type subunit 2